MRAPVDNTNTDTSAQPARIPNNGVTDGSEVTDGNGLTGGNGVTGGSEVTGGSGVTDGNGVTDGSEGALDSDARAGLRESLGAFTAPLPSATAVPALQGPPSARAGAISVTRSVLHVTAAGSN